MDAVATGARTDRDDRVADALGLGADQLVLAHEADAHRVDERIALVRGVEHDVAGHGRHADAVAVVADALHDTGDEPAHARCRRGCPKRSELSIAIGRAPIVKTSRRMPPTPVAAPWYGSTADGWLCDSILNATAESVADADHAGVFAGALQHVRRLASAAS